ncbi:hypothetical protein D9M68_537430 [compost metagenome]
MSLAGARLGASFTGVTETVEVMPGLALLLLPPLSVTLVMVTARLAPPGLSLVLR